VDAERGIFLVVDGIGGQAAGEKAAEIAVSRVRARLERQTGTVEQRIREGITMANNEILEAARGNPEWEGMACVLTVACWRTGRRWWGTWAIRGPTRSGADGYGRLPRPFAGRRARRQR